MAKKIMTHPISLFGLFFRWDGIFSGIYAITCILTGIGFLPFAIITQRDAGRLADEGIWATVVVSDLQTFRSDGNTGYELFFDIPLADGRTFTDSERVDQETYNSSFIGEEFEIFVWPPNPAINEFQKGETAKDARFRWFISIWSFILGTGLTTLIFVQSKRALWVRDNTETQTATVAKTFNLMAGFFKQRRLKWKTTDGASGQSLAEIKNTDLKEYNPNTTISVYIDPDKPKRSYWTGDLGPPLRKEIEK